MSMRKKNWEWNGKEERETYTGAFASIKEGGQWRRQDLLRGGAEIIVMRHSRWTSRRSRPGAAAAR